MKKYVLIGLIMAIVPNICFGASARFTALAREKERKMEELEKCLGSTQGLKIAGLSTLGLTAVGVAGNVYETKKIDELDQNTKKVEKKIETVEKSISEKQAEIAEKAKADAGEKALAEGGNVSDEQNSAESTVVEGMNIRQAVLRDIERLRNFEPTGVQSTIQLSGYKFCEVPSDLQSSLGDVIESAKRKCKENDMDFTYEDKTYFLESCDKKDVVSGAGQVIAKCVKEVSVNEALDSLTLEQEIQNNNNLQQTAKSGANATSACGELGQRECTSGFKICEKGGKTRECEGDMLPRNAVKGHCVPAGRTGYKICTATECDDRHQLSGGHCNKSIQTPK